MDKNELYALAGTGCLIIAAGILLAATLEVKGADDYCNKRLEPVLNKSIIIPRMENCPNIWVSCRYSSNVDYEYSEAMKLNISNLFNKSD